MRENNLGIRLHSVIDLFGVDATEASSVVALLKLGGLEAKAQNVRANSCLDIIIPGRDEREAQNNLQRAYVFLNKHGKDYEVVRTSIFDGNIYRKVI